MINLENCILSVIFFLLLCLIFYLWKYRKKKSAQKANQAFILSTLQLAIEQKSLFDIKSNSVETSHNGVLAHLTSVGHGSLTLALQGALPGEWKECPAEIFFRVKHPSGEIFYVFKSTINSIDQEKSLVEVSFPDNLKIEKKRHFIRVQPPLETVSAIGVWPIAQGKRLPKTSHDSGNPVFYYKADKGGNVYLENISASGMALRFDLGKDGKFPFNATKGRHILCLLVFRPLHENTPVVFWSTSEIMNTRPQLGPQPLEVLGLEFTNWAIQQPGSDEIHWTYSSPWKGIKPILQWVESIEMKD